MSKGHGSAKHSRGHTKRNILSAITISGLLVVSGLAISAPVYADASTNTIINLTLPTKISITGSPSVYFNSGNDLTPGVFYTSAATVAVTTNSGYGYTLSMQMSENQTSGSTNTLYYNSNEYIPSITKVQKQADFEKDPTTGGWGFALDATNFRPLPTVVGSTYNTLNLKRTHAVANADPTTLTFGLLPPTGALSTTYSNIVTVTATANDSITLSSLTISGTPTKTHYNSGAYFNTDGLTIYAVYSDGKQVLLTDGQYVVNNGNALSSGQTSVPISYTDNGTTVSNSVNGITVDGNTVNGDPVDNGTGNNNGASTGTLTVSSGSRSLGSGSDSGDNSGSGASSDPSSNNADPQGVTDSYGSSSVYDSDNVAPLVATLGLSAAVAAGGIIILAAKRRSEDDEEDEE